MQGQRSSVEPFPDTAFGFEPGSSSSQSGSMDPQLYWNNMLLNSVEPSDYTESIPCLSDPARHETLTLNTSPNALTLENVDINLNAALSDHLNPNPGPELRLCPNPNPNPNPSPYASVFGPGPSSSTSFQNPLGLGFGSDDDSDGRPGGSLESRRISCKRKNIESSASGSSSNLQNYPSSSHSSSYNIINNHPGLGSNNNIPVQINYASPSVHPVDEPFPGFVTPIVSARSNPVNSRSFRIRTAQLELPPEPVPPPPTNLWPSGTNNNIINSNNTNNNNNINTNSNNNSNNINIGARRFSLWGPPGLQQGSFEFDQPQIDTSAVHRYPRNGASSSRGGGGTASSPIDLESWGSESRGVTIPGNGTSSSSGPARAGASSPANPPVGPAWAPAHTQQSRYHRSFPEEIGRFSGHGMRANHTLPRVRPGFVLDRQGGSTSSGGGEGMWGVPLALRSTREGRRIIEIRNALELMRRGENLRFESIYYGGIEIHDRHRDMRLDIDNMSYEELLALEERIGNVSTGLSEETINKLLKQRIYTCFDSFISMEEEPCCICQEEYVEGEELGRLNCGHDFHSVCIKQWLMQKNLCPICKNTALIT